MREGGDRVHGPGAPGIDRRSEFMGHSLNHSPGEAVRDAGVGRDQKERILRWPAVLLYFYIFVPIFLYVGIETFLFISFLLFVFIWWVASREKFPDDLHRVIGPLLLILLVGLLQVSGHERYDVFKDIWYVSNAALALTAGYVLMRNLRDLGRFFSIFIIAAFFVALLHLVRFALHPELLSFDMEDIRKYAGVGFFEPGLGLTLLLVARLIGLKIFRRNIWFPFLATPVFVVSVALSFSRTQIVSLALMWLAVFGWVNFNNGRKTVLVIMATILFLTIGFLFPQQDFISGHASMLDKFLFSFQEIRVVDYRSMSMINEHWRGYETARALYTYSLGTPLQYLIGGGFGANVDLGLFMDLGGERIRFAPILHNGYMYLLVKTGMIGLFLYLLLLYRMTRKGILLSVSESREIKFCGRLIIGLSLSFVSTTFVVAGMFNKSGLLSMSILLGALLAYCSEGSPHAHNFQAEGRK
ncbi:MAG: hypothetical protein K2P57_11510 [Burkholderiales bacterium]|nr:hypothetical protein [Burkholderiales bacterium]